MARLGIKTRIIDKRSQHGFYGQADGVNARTQEIFDSFGFNYRLLHESYSVAEMMVWVRPSILIYFTCHHLLTANARTEIIWATSN
jgi:2-polyprenyl-6-methoxyphenol hydroxylase-like FAD-dependent oxidoreductase